jgi:hypothetical protein
VDVLDKLTEMRGRSWDDGSKDIVIGLAASKDGNSGRLKTSALPKNWTPLALRAPRPWSRKLRHLRPWPVRHRDKSSDAERWETLRARLTLIGEARRSETSASGRAYALDVRRTSSLMAAGAGAFRQDNFILTHLNARTAPTRLKTRPAPSWSVPFRPFSIPTAQSGQDLARDQPFQLVPHLAHRDNWSGFLLTLHRRIFRTPNKDLV